MRILKNKINALMNKRPEELKIDIPEPEDNPPLKEHEQVPKLKKKKIRKEQISISTEDGSKDPKSQSQPSSKNIVKNYGKAMCNFSCTDLSKPYRKEIFAEEKINFKRFKNFILTRKEMIESIESLRNLLLVDESDNSEIASFKRAYQKLCIIFLKYFAVNWVFHSKVTHKLAHIKARFKLMRRINNPQYFTYLKDFLR
jgi:hypothetical protein